MDIQKIRELLLKIEKIRSRKITVNYVPSFTIEVFSSTSDQEKEIKMLLTNLNYPDDDVSYELTMLDNWKIFVKDRVKYFLLDSPEFEDPKLFDTDHELKRLVDEFELEINSLKDCQCFEVKSTHKRFYELVWTDLLFVSNKETYLLHFGISD